jgi:hypothetical protein
LKRECHHIEVWINALQMRPVDRFGASQFDQRPCETFRGLWQQVAGNLIRYLKLGGDWQQATGSRRLATGELMCLPLECGLTQCHKLQQIH